MQKYNDNFKKKSEVPIVSDSFIDSINEEIRNENYKKIWGKYGKLITVVSIIMIVGAIAYNVWNNQDTKDREAVSARFSIAQNDLTAGNISGALIGFREIGKASKKTYATLAKFEYAAMLRDKKDKMALDQYKQVFEDNKVPNSLKDLAYIYYVNTALDLMSDKELRSQLPGFIASLSNKYLGKSWSILAKESLAYCYLKSGDTRNAKATLESLAKTEQIPAGMLERIRELVQYLNEQ